MQENVRICTVTALERPARQLVYLPSRHATEYFSFCEEMGCDWERTLNALPGRMDIAALLTLPPGLVEEGCSNVAAGVELPIGDVETLPEGYRTAPLPACTMLYFQAEPFEREEDYGIAIDDAFSAMRRYDAERYGWRYAFDTAPMFNFGAQAAVGARLAVPVVRIK